jgi:hypothetical protein
VQWNWWKSWVVVEFLGLGAVLDPSYVFLMTIDPIQSMDEVLEW